MHMYYILKCSPRNHLKSSCVPTRTKEMDAVLAPPPYFADGNLRPRERQSLP